MSVHDTNLAAISDASTVDARLTALALMARALEQLDSDSSIPAIAGAHLQMAIDSLWRGTSADRASLGLH